MSRRASSHVFRTAAIAGMLLLAVTTALAVAQQPGSVQETYDDLERTLHDDPNVPDTDSTPKYGPDKDGSKTWVQVAGAQFRHAGDPERAEQSLGVTSYDDNLFAVSFRNERRGLAGGATCSVSDPDAEDDCRPVLYSFTESPETGPVWTKVDLPGGDRPGYVGAIAWIDARRAMVVGGTGVYPRREPPYKPECQDPADRFAPWNVKCDPAGMARIWLLDSGQWCELRVGGSEDRCPSLPAEMRGLTAVDFRPGGDPEIGFVGGLGQLYRWQEGGGGFDKRYDNASPPDDLSQPTKETANRNLGNYRDGSFVDLNPYSAGRRRIFRFRVRAIRFPPTREVNAYAVTSGCCSKHDSSDDPAVLRYSLDTGGPGNEPLGERWTLRTGTLDTAADDPNEPVETVNDAGREPGKTGYPGLSLSPGPGYPTIDVPPVFVPTPGVPSLRERGTPVPEPPATKGAHPHRSGLGREDSFYGLTTAAPANVLNDPDVSVLLTTTSGDSELETRSQISRCQGGAAPTSIWPLSGAARLLAIDGPTPSHWCTAGPDWAVGELRTARVPGKGRRGLVLSAETAERKRPDPYYPVPNPPEKIADGYTPTDEGRVRSHLAARDQLVASYTLNALDMVHDTGSGWAVGDHGAILQRNDGSAGSGARAAKAEPEPPVLTPGRGRDLPATEPYDALRPGVLRDVRGVPGLAGRPLEQLAEPRLLPRGSPDATAVREAKTQVEDVAEIVMNRDGSEGWAIGPNPIMEVATWTTITVGGVLSLFHYDGSQWTRCDPVGVPGQLPSDPACAALSPLRRFFNPAYPSSPQNTQLIAAARVPFESDADPDNDDDFEIVAIGTPYADPVYARDRGVTGTKLDIPAVVRLVDGRWRIDRGLHDLIYRVNEDYGSFPLQLRDVAYTAPDDGWILASAGKPSTGNQAGVEWLLFHWDGERWSLCGRESGGCSGERVPFSTAHGAILDLVTAGDRIYMYGWREPRPADTPLPFGLDGSQRNLAGAAYPLILYRDRERGIWTDGSGPEEEGGGYDPGFGRRNPGEQGKVTSLSVAQRPDGTYTGWAVGRFWSYESPPAVTGGKSTTTASHHNQGETALLEPTAILMRLEGEHGGRHLWRYFSDKGGAVYDLMSPQAIPGNGGQARAQSQPQLQVTIPSAGGAGGADDAYIAQRGAPNLFRFDQARERWELVGAQRPMDRSGFGFHPHGHYQALTPDGRGGFWAAVTNNPATQWSWALNGNQVWFFHHTDRPPEPVFREVAQPFGGLAGQITALAGAPDGGVWLGNDQGRLARYDRLTGWHMLAIDGWDPGRVVTRRSEVFAIAVGEDGRGIAVGPNGRIADISPARVAIDAAAGRRCDHESPREPCGTGYDLRAAAVAPDGSALAAGNALTVLWRPAYGEFRRVPGPSGNPGTRIVGASMPRPDRAWLVSDAGYVYAGTLGDAGWSWKRENVNADGDTIGKDGHPLRAVAVDAEGHGYAVGDKGLLLERTGDPDAPWRRLRPPGTDDLLAVTLGTRGEGALIGGRNGLVLTRSGERFEVARPADYAMNPAQTEDRPGLGPTTGPVVGLGLAAGFEDGQVEGWAAVQARGDGTDRLFHYSSDPDEALLRPDRRAKALPDTPASRPGELAFAALGNMGCSGRSICSVRRRTLERREVIAERIVDELRDRARTSAGPLFALFTGDVASSAGLAAASAHKSDRVGAPGNWNYVTGIPTTDPYGDQEMANAPIAQRSWGRLVADRLEDGGLPVFGAAGGGDLARAAYGSVGAYDEQAKTGDNLTWRASMETRLAPWGKRDARPSGGRLSFERVPGADDHAVEHQNQKADPDGDGPAPPVEVKGGARTHYAADIVRGGEKVARLVTLDTALRSAQVSDPIQQPAEQKGQLEWLERMVCFEGQTAPGGERCTRGRAQELIVLTNTPTYTYAPGASLTETNTVDGIQLEALLMRHRATTVVSGRLNGAFRYWATAPGVHEPCPGGSYQETPPPPGARVCGRGTDQQATATATRHVGAVLRGLGAPAAPGEAVGEAAGGILPFVVAANAGGPFGTSNLQAEPEARDGYWAGYTIVRVPEDGNPAGVVVEQRPVLDWISLAAPKHVLRPGERLRLRGVGREPIGFNESRFTRFHAIDSAAITHRYDLLEADPERPWLPKVVEGNGNPHGYVPLDPAVATVDPQSGAVVAGRGNRPRVYALALLSVSKHAATWPLVFEPRRSFTPPAPRKLTIPPAVPPIRVLGIPAQAVPSQPPPAPPATPPIAVDLVLPPPPAIPGLPAGTPTPITPPVPPVSPPPPASVGQTASGLAANPLAILLAPTAAPIPPSSPLIQPAPPSGARREARQKQAATAKSEEGAAERASDATGDLNTRPGPPGGVEAATRRSPDRPLGFTVRARAEQPSAWVTGLQYGGGTALMALVLALGWTTVRPTPRGRRREDVDPAPAWVRHRR